MMLERACTPAAWMVRLLRSTEYLRSPARSRRVICRLRARYSDIVSSGGLVGGVTARRAMELLKPPPYAPVLLSRTGALPTACPSARDVLADGPEARGRHADDAGQEAGSGRVRLAPAARRRSSGGHRPPTVPGRLRAARGPCPRRRSAEVDIGLASGRESGDEVDPCVHRLTEHPASTGSPNTLRPPAHRTPRRGGRSGRPARHPRARCGGDLSSQQAEATRDDEPHAPPPRWLR
jgi:hypothetical protein